MTSSLASSARSRTRQDYGVWQTHQTRWSDNDQYAHMNNAASYLLFDSVINAYLIKHCGVTPPNSPLIGLVVSSYATYFAPTSFPAILELGLCVTKLGSSSVTYEVGIFEEESQTPAVVGGYTHVFVDSKTRKSKTMTGDIRAGLERLMVKETMTSKAKL